METITSIQDQWNAIADGYDMFVTASRDWRLPREALRRAGLRPGMRFLDVASGSGALSLPAARQDAKVTAVDLSPAMIERLHARARQEGLSNVDGRVMDGHALDFPDNTFDVAGSQFGVMLFPDLPRALREMVRVTRSGGRVLMVVYGPPPTVEFLRLFLDALQSVVPGFTGLPDDPPPLPFQASDPEVLRRHMEAAGLGDVRVEPGAEMLEFDSGDEMWNWVVNSNPIAETLVGDLTDAQKRDVRRTLDARLSARSGGGGIAILENLVYIGVGTK